ncbi:MAG: molybdopterin-dependent oxidoreductase [Chloroflexota bacterium]
MGDSNERVELPIHAALTLNARPSPLRVDGHVENPLVLSLGDLDALAQRLLVDDCTCVAGWSVRGVIWKGVPLMAILELARVASDTRWIQASAGEYSVPISLDDARRALLALRLGEQPLPFAHGGPVRLVVPGGECFTSVKWLDRLEARFDSLANRGRDIALGRLERAGESAARTSLPHPRILGGIRRWREGKGSTEWMDLPASTLNRVRCRAAAIAGE